MDCKAGMPEHSFIHSCHGHRLSQAAVAIILFWCILQITLDGNVFLFVLSSCVGWLRMRLVESYVHVVDRVHSRWIIFAKSWSSRHSSGSPSPVSREFIKVQIASF